MLLCRFLIFLSNKNQKVQDIQSKLCKNKNDIMNKETRLKDFIPLVWQKTMLLSNQTNELKGMLRNISKASRKLEISFFPHLYHFEHIFQTKNCKCIVSYV